MSTTDTTAAAEKPSKVTRKGLRHAHMGLKMADFFEHIDALGGWPLDYPYVGFAHSDEREAAFTLQNINHGWWTTVYHRDDYLMWKLSPAAWDRIFEAVHDDLVCRMRAQKPHPQGPKVRSWTRDVITLSDAFKERQP